MAGAYSSCIFCQIARSSTSTTLLHSDGKVVAFQDIKPSAFRHYLVIPVEHIATVKDLRRRAEDYSLVSHMLNVGQTLLHRDASHSMEYRFGFHQPPFNSVDHLHLHCLALPFTPGWKRVKYLSLGPLGGFIEAEKLLEKIKPLIPISKTGSSTATLHFFVDEFCITCAKVDNEAVEMKIGGPQVLECGIACYNCKSANSYVLF